MPGGFAPRLAIEAGFLLLLAVGAGLADLRPAVIVAVMAGAWVLVSLLEWAIWRAQAVPARAVGSPAQQAAEAEPLAAADPDGEPAADEVEEVEEAEPPLEDGGYPLRSDAGVEQAEEVEAYTRVVEPEDGVANRDEADGAQAREPSGVAAAGEGGGPGARSG